jgi:hypothetical protein
MPESMKGSGCIDEQWVWGKAYRAWREAAFEALDHIFLRPEDGLDE